MACHQEELVIKTQGRSLIDITAEVVRAVQLGTVRFGNANVFVRHTSASLIINENADPKVLHDLETFLADLVKDGDPRFTHTEEGPDDMSGHVRSVLTATSVSVPVKEGKLCLGVWQGIYLWEHRYDAHRRIVDVSVVG